jgi:hypothetical protein
MAAVVGGIAIATVVNYAIAGTFGSDIPFNVGRFVLCLIAGWVIVTQARGSLWVAALVGPFVLLIDHILLKGGYFVLAHFFWPHLVEGEGLMAAGGVAISFLMFAPVAATASWIGGLLGRRRSHGAQAHP